MISLNTSKTYAVYQSYRFRLFYMSKGELIKGASVQGSPLYFVPVVFPR
jgi:hypothetical protein